MALNSARSATIAVMATPASVCGICLDNRQRLAKSFSDPGRRRDRERFVLAPELTGHHRVFACTAGVNFHRLNQPTRLVFPHGLRAPHPHRLDWTARGRGLRPYLAYTRRIRVIGGHHQADGAPPRGALAVTERSEDGPDLDRHGETPPRANRPRAWASQQDRRLLRRAANQRDQARGAPSAQASAADPSGSIARSHGQAQGARRDASRCKEDHRARRRLRERLERIRMDRR